MTKLELCKNATWRGSSSFSNFFTGISWESLSNISLEEKQILVRTNSSYSEPYILRKIYREWLNDHDIDYSVSYTSSRRTPLSALIRLTAFIEFYKPDDAVLFKLTWM